MASIDHLVVGSADLDAGIEWVRARLGVAPVPGGSHDGLGTRNALLGLGPGQYLEVLALDPAQDGPLGPMAAGLGPPRVHTVCVALDRIDDGFEMTRVRPDGVRLRWAVRMTDTPLFFIDWRDSEHPSVGLPDGGRITSVTITTPEPAALDGVDGVVVQRGPWHIGATVNGVALA